MLILVEDASTVEVSDTDTTGDVIINILLKNKDKILKKLFIDNIEINSHNTRYSISRFNYNHTNIIKMKWSDDNAGTAYLDNLCYHIQYRMQKTKEIISLYKILENRYLNQRLIEYNELVLYPLNLSNDLDKLLIIKDFFKQDCDKYNRQYNEHFESDLVLKYRLIKYIKDYNLDNLGVTYEELSESVKNVLLDIDDI